ncbi:MAG: hypothetical protein U0575_05330 [Phycisphaerales bacterium]
MSSPHVSGSRPIASLVVATTCAVLAIANGAHAQSLGPDFKDHYTITDLGSVPGVTPSYGGLLFAPGDTSVLLIGGAAHLTSAAIDAILVLRGPDSHVTGFASKGAVFFQAAPGVSGGIDGGLDVGPDCTSFYTTYPDNHIGQLESSSVNPDRLVDLSPLGVAGSTGALRFVPPGFPGAGRLKIVSRDSSRWYDATVSPDGNGTFDIAVSPTFVQLAGGLEGIVYVGAVNPGFGGDSVLVVNSDLGQVTAYLIDANGDPMPDSQSVFITGLAGAQGAAVDPVTGDVLFSTFGGGNRVIRVSGFTPPSSCPADLTADGIVDGADLGLLLAQWGPTTGSTADLNGDQMVDGADLGAMLGAWGACAR